MGSHTIGIQDDKRHGDENRISIDDFRENGSAAVGAEHLERGFHAVLLSEKLPQRVEAEFF